MNRRLVSHLLKALLVFMGLFSVFSAFYVLPLMAQELAEEMPTIAYAKDVLLPLSQSLLMLFVLGLAVIMYLLFLFDRGKVYSRVFLKLLNALAILCLVGAIGVIIIFFYTTTLGGPGPLPSILLLGSFLLIFVIMMTLLLIKYVIEDALNYKDELDLVV